MTPPIAAIAGAEPIRNQETGAFFWVFHVDTEDQGVEPSATVLLDHKQRIETGRDSNQHPYRMPALQVGLVSPV